MGGNDPMPLEYGQAAPKRGLNLLALVSIVLPLVSVPVYFALADYLPTASRLSPKSAARVAFLVYAAFAIMGVPAGVVARRAESRRPTRFGRSLASVGIALSIVGCFVCACNYWINA